MRGLVLATAVLALGAISRRVHADDPAPALRRFALIVSSNDGGRDRVRLRFADTDGRSMADVLRQLGGLRAEDLLLVPNASRAAVEASFDRLRGLIAGAPGGGPRREVFLYYSGHSDEDGLLLGGERVTYRELREWIRRTGADVRIAVLDSCASGALIRRRGGTRAASFVGDRSVDARGHAFLTASSADEAAQESDRIGAAFFTHFLVSGLRGAADTSRDGLVTLAEAYQFAYHETLRRTEHTSGGAQHPAYDIQLTGIGDLVLTDLRSTSSSLVLDEQLAGRIHVRDASGRLVVELQKDARHPVVLGLAPGTYTVALEDRGRRLGASIAVRGRDVARLGLAQFGAAPIQTATARGDRTGAPGDDPERAGTFLAAPSWRKLGGHAGFGLRYGRLQGRDGFNSSVEFALRYRLLSIGIAGGAVVTSSDADGQAWTMGYGGLVARYHLLFGRSPFYLSIGAIAAAGAVREEGDAARALDGDGGNPIWLFEPQLGGHLNLTRWLRVGLDVGYRLVAALGELDARGLRGITGGFHAQIGWF